MEIDNTNTGVKVIWEVSIELKNTTNVFEELSVLQIPDSRHDSCHHA